MFRKILAVALLSTCYLLQAANAIGQPPVNDNASGAIMLQVGGGCSIPLYSNINATQAPNEPLASCSDDPLNPIYSNKPIVWFKFIAPASGAVKVSTDNGNNGGGGATLHDTQVALFSATDPSDYTTFQIIACDDDNGYINSVASIFYVAELTPGQTYYVSVDGWQPPMQGTFCLTIDEINNTMLSTTNTCSSSYPAAWGGSSQWPINPHYKGWISLVDNTGHIVANVRDTLGGYANAFTCGQNVHMGAVRQLPSGTYYLDRNYLIHSTAFAANVELQFFFLNTEFNALNTAVGGNLALNNIHVIKQDLMCQNNFAVNTPDVELPQDGCLNQYVGTTGTVSWVTSITPGFPSPGYSNFYLVPGPGPDTIHTSADINLPCFVNSAVLQPTDTGSGYTWSDGSTGIKDTVYTTGTYWVRYLETGGCTVNIDSFNVHVSPFGDIVTGAHTACVRQDDGTAWASPLPGDTTVYTYTWTNNMGQVLQVYTNASADTLNNLLPGIYNVAVSTSGNCDTTFHITVYADSAGFTNQDTTCEKQLVAFTNTSFSGNGLVNYTWSFSNGVIDTATNQVQTFNTPATYMVTLVANFGFCSDTVIHNISVVPFSASLHQDICYGDSVRLSPIIIAPGDFSNYIYAWSPSTGLDSATILSPLFYQQPGNYTYIFSITAQSPFGCTISDTVTVDVRPELTLTNVTPDQVIKYGSSIMLNADGAVYYFWIPNNGTLNNPDIKDPVATPLDSTTYMVTGIDSLGCKGTATVAIGIDYNMTEFVPNAFSPNKDGKNDVFKVGDIKYQKLIEMRVFNRWGQQVFYTIDPSVGWDGTYLGTPQDIGTYSYIIIVSRPDGTERSYKGAVTLIR